MTERMFELSVITVITHPITHTFTLGAKPACARRCECVCISPLITVSS
jgi:hypothetical protein